MIKFTDPGVIQRTETFAMRTMLKHAQPVQVTEKFGVVRPMSKNKGANAKFRRPLVFTPATTPLTEGVTPASRSFRYEDVEVSLAQYGEVIEFTDVIEDLHEDPVVRDISIQAGENLGRTKEALNWAVLTAGTNVYYANGSTRSAVNSPITLQLQRSVIRGLRAQKAMMFTSVLDGSINLNTTPIEASYIAIAHTDCEADIRNMEGFVPVAKYGTRKTVCPEELGTVENVRYVLSPDLDPILGAGSAVTSGVVSQGGANVDIYPVLFLGKEAYGTVPLRGKHAVDPSIIPASEKTKDDPLAQRGLCGWKMWHAAVILNQLWMARAEVGVTELI